MKALGDDKVQDRDDVSFVGCHIEPQLPSLQRKCAGMMPCHLIHALQQLLAPIPCSSSVAHLEELFALLLIIPYHLNVLQVTAQL